MSTDSISAERSSRLFNLGPIPLPKLSTLAADVLPLHTLQNLVNEVARELDEAHHLTDLNRADLPSINLCFIRDRANDVFRA